MFTIVFKNYDGTVLETVEVEEGATPEYSGDTPEKPADVQFTYTFSAWLPEVVAATADAEYTATYTATINQYDISFVDDDGTTVLKEAVAYDYGTSATDIVKPDDPTKQATAQYTYTFSGWSPAIAEVTGDQVYQATYSSVINKYTVTFYDEDGTTELQSEELDYGTTPTPPDVPEYPMMSVGWNPAVATVTEDADYTLVYSQNVIPLRINDASGEGCMLACLLLGSASDVDAIPDRFGPGSVAFLADMTKVWVCDTDRTWTESTTDALALLGLM